MDALRKYLYGPKFVANPIEEYFDRITRYQVYVYAMFTVSKYMMFFHMLNHMVISPKMNFYCGGSRLDDGSYSGVLNQCPCEETVHWDTTYFSNTAQTKYGLYCGREWLVSFSKTMLYVGLFFGVTLYGMLADKVGRIPATVVSYFMIGVSGCLAPFMPEVISFCIMRMIEGLGTGGAVVVVYVIVVEYCGPSNRGAVSGFIHLPLNVAHSSLGLLSYLIRDWTLAMITMSVPCILFGFLTFLVLESPRWLVDSGKIDKGAEVMKKICKHNKKPCEDMGQKINTFLAQSEKPPESISIRQCLKHKPLFLNFLVMAGVYFTIGFSYYGLSQFISEMSDSPFLNITVSGACLIPGTIVTCILLGKVRRKLFLMICFISAGLTFLPVIFLPDNLHALRVGLSCISNCLFFMAFIIQFLYACELFPTSARNSILGLLSTISRIGQIVSPVFLTIKVQYVESLFVVLAIVSAALLYFLPETFNTILPSTIEDSLIMAKSGRGLRLRRRR